MQKPYTLEKYNRMNEKERLDWVDTQMICGYLPNKKDYLMYPDSDLIVEVVTNKRSEIIELGVGSYAKVMQKTHRKIISNKAVRNTN